MGQAGGWTTAQGYPEVVNDPFKPRCAPGRPWRNAVTQRLAENPPRAGDVSATEPADLNAQMHSTAVRGKIQQPPFVAAMNLDRLR